MLLRRIPLLVALCGLMPAAAQKKPVTVQDVVSRAPGPAVEIVWSPGGNSFAYEQGGAIRLFDVPAKTPRTLLRLSELETAATPVAPPLAFEWQNRGVKEQTIQWFPDGEGLLLAAKGDLFRFQLAAGAWSQLTSTPVAERDPKLSPDGRLVSFRRGSDLFCLDLASRRDRAAH